VTIQWFTAMMMLIYACVVMVFMNVDQRAKWRELKADVKRDLRPEAPGDS